MRLPWQRRHKCPPDVSIQILINDEPVVGWICGEDLAYIAKYSGENHDLLEGMNGKIENIKMNIRYSPRK